MILGIEDLYFRAARMVREEPNAFVMMKEDPELRMKAINRLKQQGHKQPKVPQIIAEIKRMTR